MREAEATLPSPGMNAPPPDNGNLRTRLHATGWRAPGRPLHHLFLVRALGLPGDLRTMRGCGKDGCDKSSVGAGIPFQNDPTGAEYTAIYLQHSGRVLSVPGASTSDGVKLTQFFTVRA